MIGARPVPGHAENIMKVAGRDYRRTHYRAGCKCGWSAKEAFPMRKSAEFDYEAHREEMRKARVV